MTLLFPMAEVDATALKSFLEVLAYLLGVLLVVGAAAKLFMSKRPTEIAQPLVVEKRERYTPVELTEKLQKDLDTLREQRRIDVAGLHRKIEEGLQQLHNDLAKEFKEVREQAAAQRESVAALKADTATQTRQILNLDGKLDEMPGRILALLGGYQK